MFDGVPQHPLINNLQSPMQILASRSARSNLPMSNTVRRQKDLAFEHLRTQSKNEQVPLHDLHLDQVVMYQDPNDKNGIQPPLPDCAKNQEVT